MQAFTLAIFALLIAIMGWILWSVTNELGDLESFRRQPLSRESSIRIRNGQPIRMSQIRSPRF